MTEVVLDASALLALLLDEEGASIVADRLEGALISTVNFAEVVGHYARLGAEMEDVQSMLLPLPLNIVAVDTDIAFEAGMMRSLSQARALSLGDRICLAFARAQNCPVLTADRAWRDVAQDLQVTVELIR